MRQQNSSNSSPQNQHRQQNQDDLQHSITINSSPDKNQSHQPRPTLTNQSCQLHINKKLYKKIDTLQLDRQTKIDQMIRTEVFKQGNINQKLTLEDNQTCFSTSEIYTKDSSHWKNRQISQLTSQKLDSIPIQDITKIKLLNQQPMNGYNLFRVTVNQKKIKDFAIRSNQVGNWFADSLIICLTHLGHKPCIQRKSQQQIEGLVLKKSKFLGQWQPRYATITPKSLLSSTRKKGQTATTKLKQLTQLWSRIQTITYQNTTYLIIKMWCLRAKYQFGVPVLDAGKWARALSTLVK